MPNPFKLNICKQVPHMIMSSVPAIFAVISWSMNIWTGDRNSVDICLVLYFYFFFNCKNRKWLIFVVIFKYKSSVKYNVHKLKSLGFIWYMYF
jgi:hypothetical protein